MVLQYYRFVSENCKYHGKLIYLSVLLGKVGQSIKQLTAGNNLCIIGT